MSLLSLLDSRETFSSTAEQQQEEWQEPTGRYSGEIEDMKNNVRSRNAVSLVSENEKAAKKGGEGEEIGNEKVLQEFSLSEKEREEQAPFHLCLGSKRHQINFFDCSTVTNGIVRLRYLPSCR